MLSYVSVRSTDQAYFIAIEMILTLTGSMTPSLRITAIVISSYYRRTEAHAFGSQYSRSSPKYRCERSRHRDERNVQYLYDGLEVAKGSLLTEVYAVGYKWTEQTSERGREMDNHTVTFARCRAST
jgi:hypothetical protein